MLLPRGTESRTSLTSSADISTRKRVNVKNSEINFFEFYHRYHAKRSKRGISCCKFEKEEQILYESPTIPLLRILFFDYFASRENSTYDYFLMVCSFVTLMVMSSAIIILQHFLPLTQSNFMIFSFFIQDTE